jgi:hypothetical protein
MRILIAAVVVLIASPALGQPISANRCAQLLQHPNPQLLSLTDQGVRTTCMYQQSGAGATGMNAGTTIAPTPGSTYGGWGGAPLLGERR